MQPTAAYLSLTHLLKQRIVLLDGAMGTQIQQAGLAEADYGGNRFNDHSVPLQGNNDLLTLTQPDLIRDIHLRYIKAGADIIETNTFGANRLSQGEYQLAQLSCEINQQAAILADEARKQYYHEGGTRKIYLAGALGPTTRSASLSPEVNDPGFRNVDFQDLVQLYQEAALALLQGGVDCLLIETIFDTLNGKAGIVACHRAMRQFGSKVPLLISFTLTDLAGRTLSGQTPEAAAISLEHGDPVAMGMNCALGPKEMNNFIYELSKVLAFPMIIYPNAGLPNAMGGYDETPTSFSKYFAEWAEAGHINIAGGCCGTTPEHIAAIKESIAACKPRRIPPANKDLQLAGLVALTLAPNQDTA